MISAYSPEVAELHKRKKAELLNKISLPASNISDYFNQRSIRLETILNTSPVPTVLAILEWNYYHSDLRDADSNSTEQVPIVLSKKMDEEVDEYEEVLGLSAKCLKNQNLNKPWYMRDEAELLWKVGGEIADAGIFAIGILESLGYDAWQIVNASSITHEPSVYAGRIDLGDSSQAVYSKNADHVIKNVIYQADKIHIPISSIMFYKALQNEQHRANALHAEHQLKGYSKTVRRSVGPLKWNELKKIMELDSQIPAMEQSWVGPTIIETHVEKSEYERETLLKLRDSAAVSDAFHFTSLYPIPEQRQKEIEIWRSQ